MEKRQFRIRSRLVIAATLILLGVPGPEAGGQTTLPDFPRLGGMLIGNPHNYGEPDYQEQIARLDLAILGIYYGWGDNGETPAQAVAAIKAINPKILLGNYTVMTETPYDDGDTATAYKRDKLYAEVGPNGIGDWWAYDRDGNHTDWSGGAFGAWDTNLTLLTTPDAAGDHWPEWLAGADYEHLLQGVDFDIWYCDNNFWRPRSEADWNRDGSNDSIDSIPVRNWIRNGQRAYYDRAKTVAPGLLVVVNADSDLDGTVFPTDADAFKQYKNVLHGAFIEHAIGVSWSVETWGGWSLMMSWYQHIGANLLDPKIVMFDAYLASTTDYQSFRYAFASCLMDDGYFSGGTDYNQIVWFDEFDLTGASTTKWLGKAVDQPQTKAWKQSVYRRRFSGGMALVNPKGNGVQTLSIPRGYRHVRGNQDPVVNNGRRATSVTLADRDGVLLVKSR